MIARLMIAIILTSLPSMVAAAWQRATSEHFIIYSDTEVPTLRAFTEKLERFDTLLRGISNTRNVDAGNKLTIFVLSGESITKLSGRDNVSGFYRAGIDGSFAFVPRSKGIGGKFDAYAQTVLFHEYAHHFMLQYYPVGYPAWYVEGFAEYVGTAEVDAFGGASVGQPPQHRFYGLVALRPFPVERLLAADQGKMDSRTTESFYGWSWLLTHYLRFEPARKGQLQRYLKDFSAGAQPEEAARNAFGDLDQLQRHLIAYRKARQLSFSKITGLKIGAIAVEIVELDAAESAMMPLFARSARGPRTKKEVPGFARSARRMTTKYPRTAMALELVAEGELDAEDFAAAATANEALLAQRPNDARALLRRARIAIGRLGKDGGDTIAWKAARSLVVKANRTAPNDPFTLATYYDTYVKQKVRPPVLAQDGLARAVELAPQVAEIRLQLGSALMLQEKKEEARVIVAPLLNDPHSEENRIAARAILSGAKPETKKPEKDSATPTFS